MSTTFGIALIGSDHIEPIARRVSLGQGKGCEIYFINDLAKLLDDDVEVIPMDNTHQGIYTIGDIRKKIAEDKGIEPL